MNQSREIQYQNWKNYIAHEYDLYLLKKTFCNKFIDLFPLHKEFCVKDNFNAFTLQTFTMSHIGSSKIKPLTGYYSF